MTSGKQPQTPENVSRADSARVAAAVLLSVLASVWLIGDGNVRSAILRWLLLVTTIGCVANSQAGLRPLLLLVASVVCSATIVAGIAFQAFLLCRQSNVLVPPLLTGINLCIETLQFNSLFLGILLLGNTAGIFLGAQCRPLTVDTLAKLPRYASHAKQAERALRTILVTVTAIFILLSLAAKI